MNFWNRYPLLRVLIPFVAGIVIRIIFPDAAVVSLWIIALLALYCSIHAFFLFRYFRHRLRWIYGSVLFVFFFLSGDELCRIRHPSANPDHFSVTTPNASSLVVRLTEPVEVREKTCRSVVEVVSCRDSSGKWMHTGGYAMVYFRRDSLSELLDYGDIVLISTPPEPLPGPMNPYEFDYKRYLQFKGVTHRAFVPSGSWIPMGFKRENPLVGFAFNLRNKLLDILLENGLQGKEFAVVAALLIGYTDKLDPDLMREYSGTGAMHILSVSGMHVGIIFVVLNFLLAFLDRVKGGAYIKALLLLSFIWFYALLTGLSPSVMRAAAMISFIVTGKAFRQPPDVYNTIAASAFFLLIINPYYIADTGFQLSYMAVLGIVSIYPPLNKLWCSRFWIFRKIWSLIAVSLAAQLITFPLCLLYFRQFPNYFLLTNLVAVPLSGLVMYTGIAVLLTSFVSFISNLLSKLLILVMSSMNLSIHIIEGLPYSVTHGLVLRYHEAILLYIIIIFISVWLMLKKRYGLMVALCAAILMISSFTFNRWQRLQQNSIIIYSVPKALAVDFVCGEECISLVDSIVSSDRSRRDFHITPAREHMAVRSVINLTENDSAGMNFRNDVLFRRNIFIQFRGTRIGILHTPVYGSEKVKLDILLIGGKLNMKAQEILDRFQTALVVIDGTSSRTRAKRWKKEFDEKSVPAHILSSDGAYVTHVR